MSEQLLVDQPPGGKVPLYAANHVHRGEGNSLLNTKSGDPDSVSFPECARRVLAWGR